MKEKNNRKVVLVGTGFVGMSYAYALLNQGICEELVLIDINKQRAIGEAMDLNHGLAFAESNMKIYAGDYKDCTDADIVAICAGVAQKPGESRIDLLQRNTQVFKTIIEPVVESGFHGVFLIATNPVDIMTRVTQRLSGFECSRVVGTGTALDSARLRYQLGQYFSVDPRNIHAYVIGEHGDSEFVPWSQAMLSTKSILTIFEQYQEKYHKEDLEKMSEEVKNAAQEIIAAKKATYYGIGMAMARISRAIMGDENSVLTVSTMMQGEYGLEDVYLGIPCIVGRDGIKSTITLALTQEETSKLHHSAEILRSAYESIKF